MNEADKFPTFVKFIFCREREREMVGWARETEIEIRLDGETFKKICRKKSD